MMVIAFFSFISKLIYMIIRYRPEVAYYPITPTQTGWIGRDLWCLLICRLLKVKTIIHLRGSHFKLNFESFLPIVKKFIKNVCSNVSLALVQASCLCNQFDGLIQKNRVRVLYNAIDVNEYNTSNISDYLPNQILFMGHMTKAKGYCDLVRVIPIVAEKYKNIKFNFVGTLREGERGVFFDQTNGKPLEYENPFSVHWDILDSKYKSNYEHLGVISGKKKIEVLKRTNIFILPSYSEGFSRALLEAMTMGKPVICTPVGAHKDIIKDGENGFIVMPGDTETIAKKIITLLKNTKQRENIAAKNYRYVRENFHINFIAQQMKDYIEQVVKEDV